MPGVKVFIKGLGEINFPEGMAEDAIAEAVRKGMLDGSLETAAGLPMDPASKRARSELWGGPEDYYHGSTHNIPEFETARSSPDSDWGAGTYATNSPLDASVNYASTEGPDLRGRIARETEVSADNYAFDEDMLAMDAADLEPNDQILMDILEDHGATYDEFMDASQEGGQLAVDVMSEYSAASMLRGENQGVVYPLKIAKDDYAIIGGDERTILEDPDYYEQARKEIDRADYEDEYDYEDAITDRVYELREDDPDSVISRLNDAMESAGVPESDRQRVLENAGIEDGELDLTWLRGVIADNDISAEGFDGPVFGGPAAGAIIQELGFPGIIDRTVDAKFGTNKRGFGGARLEGMPGVTPETEHVITFPGNEHRLRSKFANFDPASAKSKDLMRALVPVAVATGIAATPEEAEAKGLSQLKREMAQQLATNERLMELGYLAPENIERPDQVKRAITRFMKNAEKNPAFLQREILHEQSPLSSISRESMGQHQYVDPENLLGRTGVPVVGDRSTTGINLVAPGVEDQTRVEGGALYPLEHQGTGDAWASMKDAADKKQANIDFAAEQTGQDVVGVYSATGPGAVSFSTPPAEHMVKATQVAEIPQAAKRAMDAKMRAPTVAGKKLWPGVGNDPNHPDKTKRGWVGIDHPDALDQIMGRNGYPNIGNRRTWFTSTFGSKEADSLGFPSLNDVVREITQPELMDVEVGSAGFSLFEGRPGAETHPDSRHQTYNTAIPGEYVGGFEQQLPPEAMWPQTWADLSALRTKAGKPFSREQKTGSFMMNPSLYERFDEQWLEGVQHYMRTGELPQAREGDANAIARQKAAYQAMKGEIDPRLLAAIAAGSTGIAAGVAGAPRRFQAAGNIAQVVGRGLGGMALGGLKGLYSLATGQGIDKAVNDIQGMNEWAMEGFEPRAQEVQDMEQVMGSMGERFRTVVGDQAVDAYMHGFERAGDAAYETLEELDMPQAGAVVGAGIRGLEVLSPI